MIRFAVPPIGGAGWFGGWMYMRNIVRTMAIYGDPEIEICVFVGDERSDDPFIAELRALPRTRIIVDVAFREVRMRRRVLTTLVTGRNAPLLDAFARERIDVALDWATYYGWRSNIPVIAWFPDFQHRLLPHMFGRIAWWKRELGFRAQIAASQRFLISSAAAEQDCLRFYPATRGRTNVVRFAVPIDGWPDSEAALSILKNAGIPRDFVFLPNQLWYHKNHRLAIEAAGILARRGSKRIIVATGRGEDPRRPGYRQELIAHIEKCAATDSFLLLDGVDHATVQAMMVGANALLNPSRFEGWSTTVEEAKAVGTPMLLSDIPVHHEQAPHARFFGTDDATSLADAIEAAPVRPSEKIVFAMAAAQKENFQRQVSFGVGLSEMVRNVAKYSRKDGRQ